MKRTKLVGLTVCVLCGIAFFVGWKSASGRTPIVQQHVRLPGSPPPPRAMPPDFGSEIYRSLGSVPFSEYYDLLHRAGRELRMQWLQQLNDAPEGARKIAALCAFFRAFVRVDPRTACEVVIALPRHRAPAIDAMVDAAPPMAMPELAEMMYKLPYNARNYSLTDHLELVVSKWAQVDPHAVVRFLESCQERSNRQEQVDPDGVDFVRTPLQYSGSLIRAWAGIDHTEAREWLEKQDLNEAWSLSEEWLKGWFETDLDSATTYALSHSDDKQVRSVLTDFSLSIFDQSDKAGIEFIKKLPTPEMRSDALDSLARCATDHTSALAYAPSAVAKCLVQFPMAEWPEKFGEVIADWLSEQPNECAGWVTQLPPEMQTRFVQQYPIPDLELPNPEWGLMVLLNLPQSDFRKQLIEHVMPQLKSASGPVREIVEQMNIPDRYKAEISPLLPEGRGTTDSPEPEEAQ